MIKLFTTTFDECIKIIDTLEVTVEEAEAVEAVAQQVLQKEQTDAFERENLLGGLKTTGEAIRSFGLYSFPDSVFRSSNALSSSFSSLPDIKVFASAVPKIEPALSALVKSNGLAIGNEELVQRAQRMSEALASPLSQISISQKFNESLKANRITAALDKPIVIDSTLSRLGINENTDLAAKQKTDFLGVKAADLKIQIDSLENPKSGKE